MARRALLFLLVASHLHAQDWAQWGRTASHEGATPAAGDRFDRIEAQIVIDPFVAPEKAEADGELAVHYPVPLVDGNDLYLLEKAGTYTTKDARETQTWNVKDVRRTANGYIAQWITATDWKPVPSGGDAGPSWEPVFHALLTSDSLWAPGLGGTMLRIRRSDGVVLARFNPFGAVVDPTIFTAGPPSVDTSGNIFYTAIQLNVSMPWTSDPPGSWLVRIGADGMMKTATFVSLTPNAPAANDLCTTTFRVQDLPFPPAPNATPPSSRCGPQRPAINSTPAVGADGTVYAISRSHYNDRDGFLIAVSGDLTPRWASTLRKRLADGCGVGLPPNGAAGGCRDGAHAGIDPADNQLPSARVLDDSTSSPVVLPDGNIVYGAYTRYNYAQGHLMLFTPGGAFVGSYPFGWDITPGVARHGDTYSIVLKENHHDIGSYCTSEIFCPARNDSAPDDPEQYFITRLDPRLRVEWQFKNTETDACERAGTTVRCVPETSHGFEWCVNAVAIDHDGVAFANSEDGHLYAINADGTLRQRIFLDSAIGAAYTPLSIGGDGRIYAQNNGSVFVISTLGRRRAVGR